MPARARLLGDAAAIAPEDVAAEVMAWCLNLAEHRGGSDWVGVLAYMARARGSVPSVLQHRIGEAALALLNAGDEHAPWLFRFATTDAVRADLVRAAKDLTAPTKRRSLACSALGYLGTHLNHRRGVIESLTELRNVGPGEVRYSVVEALVFLYDGGDRDIQNVIARIMDECPMPSGLPAESLWDWDRNLHIPGLCAAALLERGEEALRTRAIRRCLRDPTAYLIAMGIHNAHRSLNRRSLEGIVTEIIEAFGSGGEKQRENCVHLSGHVPSRQFVDEILPLLFAERGAEEPVSWQFARASGASARYHEVAQLLETCSMAGLKSPGHEGQQGKTFLVVTDHDTDRQWFEDKSNLSTPNVRIEYVGSAAACLHRLSATAYDAIIVDDLLHADGADGSQLLAILRRRRVPSILMCLAGDERFVKDQLEVAKLVSEGRLLAKEEVSRLVKESPSDLVGLARRISTDQQ